MSDIQTRPFSKNYSGLVNQSVIALVITVLCVTGQELMKRARRGKNPPEGLGSRESWGFGYLYQGRSWALWPSPPSPRGWPLSWVPQAIKFPESEMNRLRGLDATLYIRFLRGCFWFALLHTVTTFPILFPIHVHFSDDSVSPKSMTRASISSLVETPQGLSLLWVHICLLFWITLSWMGVLFWICHGAFLLREASIKAHSERDPSNPRLMEFHPHPHPQYGFTEVPSLDNTHPNEGLRLRTIMVSNVLPQLRDEKKLKEYFEYFMIRKIGRPAMGVHSTTQPGFFNKSIAFLFNRARRIPALLPSSPIDGKSPENKTDSSLVPVIDRVVISRKMTELASLLERREDVLRQLETAHIKLARKALTATKHAMDLKEASKPFKRTSSRAAAVAMQRRNPTDPELGDGSQRETMTEQERTRLLINVLGPFVEEFELRQQGPRIKKFCHRKTKKDLSDEPRADGSQESDAGGEANSSSDYPPTTQQDFNRATVWEALLDLPRETLDAYQPLVNLSHLFRGKTVPAIDYFTAKLNLLTSLITENRAKSTLQYDPVSTAFVTFADPEDARRACKYLAVHPDNPLACMVSMAPQYQDLDWIRVMKNSYDAEFVKDWVVSLGVWGFTLFWLFPVSLFVGLVSIQNISTFWPKLKTYLDNHPWEEEVIQSFVPTLLVALLALLIPLILLLIAKKAHNITTLSALHDRIMTRYYKFLIVNVLVFFCVGTAALQSVLQSFSTTVTPDVLKIVADSFPSAGPFYVGWIIFTMSMHGGFEIMLLGLPLILYPNTRRQVTPRKRAVGTRPRTFNYYYWLPTHLLVVHVLLLFALLNPFLIPFGTIYYFVEIGVVKNQLIHVYAKNYEGNGKLILIRVVRYSLDGLILAQAVFLAYMVVLKKDVNVGLCAFLIVFTTVVKIWMTLLCRTQFEHDDLIEARIICGIKDPSRDDVQDNTFSRPGSQNIPSALMTHACNDKSKFTWRLPAWVTFTYSSMRHGHHPAALKRQPNPFHSQEQSFSRLASHSSEISPNAASPPISAEPSYPMHFRWPSSRPTQLPPLSNELPMKIPNVWHDSDSSGPVVPHPPPPIWDDQTTVDLPYDNPFYTRPINNYLWLPRNPCGTLDLDDTVDLKTPITVDLTASPLGTWTGLHRVSSPTELSHISSRQSNGNVSLQEAHLSGRQVINGTEDIELPPSIARRVEAGEGENDDSIHFRRPSVSTWGRPSTGRSSTSGNLPFGRRPSQSPAAAFRSFSNGHSSSRPRTSSFLSVFETRQKRGRAQERPTSAKTMSGQSALHLRPDAHAQAEFVDGIPSTSRINVNRATPRNISTQHAIVHEVMAQEELALVSRIQEEKAEAQKAAATKSWITSWMFKKPESLISHS